MAKIIHGDLSHEKPEGKFIDFIINIKIQFEEYEKEIDWCLQMKFFERTWWRKKLFHETKKTLHASELKLIERFEEKIEKKKVDLEWGDEEVFVVLNLEPLQEPKKDSFQTNKCEVET